MTKIVIIGASGYVGKPTVSALLKKVDPSTVYVATRNPDAAVNDAYKAAGAHVIPGDLNDIASVKAAFTGASVVYIIAPGVETRGELTVAGINAAKEAGVGHLVVLSVSLAGVTTTVFGRQFQLVEQAAKTSGLPWTIIRLPVFTDNNWAQADTIKSIGKFFGPVRPDVRFSSVSVEDAGEAGATILANPASHNRAIYHVVSPLYTHAELAAAFTASTGKTVEYVQVPFEAAEASFLEKGWPAWQVTGLIEYLKAIDLGVAGYADEDFKTITGKAPQTIQQWVEGVKGGFQ